MTERRRSSAPRVLAAAAMALALGATGVVLAHVRLTTDGGNPLFWSSPGTISLVINSAGSDDIPDGSHTTAVRNALDGWNAIEQSTAVIIEDASPAQQARTDWANDGIHLVLFDETYSSPYFSPGSGIVAITPISYFVPSGIIADADILFNGGDHAFTTSAQPGRFDVQDVVTHELGHLLGLDHSGWAGATMYPYVDPTVILHRSLSMDEVRGLRDAYPSQGFATITGQVVRSDGTTPVSGAHVVARDANGRTTAGTLTDGAGNFTLRSLPGATFTVYATPLEGGVSSTNFGVLQAIQTNFQSTVLGTGVSTGGGSAALGAVPVDDDTSVRLGSPFDNYPLRVVAGTTQSVTIRGSDLLDTTPTVSDPTFTVGAITLNQNDRIRFDLTVPPGAPNGHVDVQVTDLAGERSILPAALEVTPPDPTVDAVAPAIGPSQGGTALTITGTGFHAGSRVVVGTRIYRDGQPGGCVVQSPTQITLTTNSTMPGSHDVVVFDPSGVEGRLTGAFTAAAPRLDTVFPVAGNAAGGTALVLRGNDFLAGATVEIDGVVQTSASVVALDRIELSTEAAAAGGPHIVRVTNPGGATAELAAAFAYVAGPDPEIAALSPPVGPAAGGTSVSIQGSNFDADTTVVFGADPTTGLGGTQSASVTVLGPTDLRAVAPAGSGTVSVLVRQGDTGQADVLAGSFTYQAPPAVGGGGGGGGCSIELVSGPPNARDALANGAWFALLLALLAARARRVPAPARADRRQRAPLV